MLVLLGCNAKEEPGNSHEDPKKEKTREEFIKEKLGIPAEAQITYETFGVVGYPSYLLAKNKKTFYFYKYDGDYKVLAKHIETLPEDIEFRGEKVGQINTQRIEPILYQKNNIAIGGIRVSFAIVENPSYTSFQYEYYSKKFVLSDEAVKVVDIPYEIQGIEYMEGIGCFITMADNYQSRLLYDTNWNLWGKVPLYFHKYPYSGKKSFAEWKLQDQMAKTPEAAQKILADLGRPAVEKAKEEAKEIQKLIDEQKGGFKLEPWDWAYYAEQVRKAKYDLDENEIKPYFEVKTVLEKGIFFAAEKFYGITAKRRTDLPVYHPDVLVYEIFDNDGKSMAIYYVDFFSRDSKRGGAWMNSFVKQSKLFGQKPVIVNVLNNPKPADGKPALVSFDEASTMFHEFGHTLHGLFANQQYATLSGTSVARDFVEFPSQINEFFALEPEILKNYAIHYQTKEPIPQALVEKMKKAATFNNGFASTEILASAAVDMAWHSITNENQLKPTTEFETEALKKYGLYLPQVPPRYHSPYFAHIWGGGYASGYYAYTWSDMLTSDAWDWITQHGGMTRANGDHFRKNILSVGNTLPYDKAYFNFAGRKPSLKALLKDKGFTK